MPKADIRGRPELPQRFQPKQPIRASDMNMIRKAVAFILEDLIKAGPGIITTKLGNSFVISTQQRNQRQYRGDNHPWKVTRIGAEGNWQVTMQPGTIGGILPSNILSPVSWDGLDATRYIKIDCGLSSSGVESATVVIDGTPPASIGIVEGGVPDSLEVLVAIIATGKVSQVAYNNITVVPLEAFESDKLSVSPGEYPLNKWWTWEVK